MHKQKLSIFAVTTVIKTFETYSYAHLQKLCTFDIPWTYNYICYLCGILIIIAAILMFNHKKILELSISLSQLDLTCLDYTSSTAIFFKLKATQKKTDFEQFVLWFIDISYKPMEFFFQRFVWVLREQYSPKKFFIIRSIVMKICTHI